MTVAQLIEKLLEMPQDSKVTAASYDQSDWEVEDVEVLEGNETVVNLS